MIGFDQHPRPQPNYPTIVENLARVWQKKDPCLAVCLWSYVYESFQRLDNVRLPIADDDDVRGLISFSQQIHVLCQQCSDGRHIRMEPGQRAHLNRLQRFKEACNRKILQKYG